MTPKLSESHVEDAALGWLAGLRWAAAHGPDIGPDGRHAERLSYEDVILTGRLRDAEKVVEEIA